MIDCHGLETSELLCEFTMLVAELIVDNDCVGKTLVFDRVKLDIVSNAADGLVNKLNCDSTSLQVDFEATLLSTPKLLATELEDGINLVPTTSVIVFDQIDELLKTNEATVS